MAGNTSYTQIGRLSKAKSREYSLVDKFPLTYRNREDITNLPPGVLIVGSKNVISNVSERLGVRKGYVLDGPTSSVLAGIASSFDWTTSRNNGGRNMRAGFLDAPGNGKLQYRYVDSLGNITWRDLVTGLNSVNYNFTTFWNTTEQVREMLFVNGQSQIQSWTGATAEVLSASPSLITKTGTTSWLDAGFYSVTSGRNIVIGGVTYTYTGGETTTTLTGVSPDPSLIAPGSVVHQGVTTTLNSAMSGITATFTNGLIEVLNNQIFVGSLTSSVLWISKVNSYTDYTSSTPRQTGEGSSLILDTNLVALRPQENYMYVSAGVDRWYNVSFELQTSTVGVTYEQVNALPLKTGARQGAMSQAFVSHMKNNIITLTNEPTIDTFGRVEDSLVTPQTTNISDSIKLDMDAYDFTGGSIGYNKFNIVVAIPVEELMLVYGLNTKSWEAPQTIPVSRFYEVNGELYGHSCITSESYQLFTGNADRVYPGFAGYPIDAVMRFSFENYGSRFTYKKSTSLYVEGYISAATEVTATITYELDGCATSVTKTIDGSDKQIVCISNPAGSFGKVSFGKSKFGGSGTESLTGLPPKFRVEKTFQNTNFFESSVSFEILGADSNFELLAFGLNASGSSEEPTSIRQ